MSTPRQTIRNAIAALCTGTVYTGKRDAISASRLPASCVYFGAEQIEPSTIGPSGRTQRRELEISVELTHQAASEEAAENAADDAASALETAIGQNNTLSGAVQDVYVQQIEFEATSEGKKPQATATVSIVAIYATTEAT